MLFPGGGISGKQCHDIGRASQQRDCPGVAPGSLLIRKAESCPEPVCGAKVLLIIYMQFFWHIFSLIVHKKAVLFQKKAGTM